MDIEQKYNLGKKTIFTGWIIAIFATSFFELIGYFILPSQQEILSVLAYSFLVIASLFLLGGCVISSRGTNTVLDSKVFNHLLLGDICKIPAILFIVTQILRVFLYRL